MARRQQLQFSVLHAETVISLGRICGAKKKNISTPTLGLQVFMFFFSAP
jgi:hypothetical protein